MKGCVIKGSCYCVKGNDRWCAAFKYVCVSILFKSYQMLFFETKIISINSLLMKTSYRMILNPSTNVLKGYVCGNVCLARLNDLKTYLKQLLPIDDESKS